MSTDATQGGAQEGAGNGTPEANPTDATTQDTPKSFTEADVKSQISAAINEAKRAWKADQDALIADRTKDAETKLTELQAKAEEAERYADFVDAATKAGIRNSKSAYIVAKHGGFIDKKGRIDMDAFRSDNPEFFAPLPDANAGAGAGQQTQPTSMNDLIRDALRRPA